MFTATLLLTQVQSAALYTNGWLLSALFFFFTFCGLASSGGKPAFSRGVYLFSAILPPLVFGAFFVHFPGEELIPYGLIAAAGFCLGQSSGEIQGRSSHLFSGFSAGIIFLLLSVFPFYGLMFCTGILILTRIPGIITKNMEKEFDFSSSPLKITR